MLLSTGTKVIFIHTGDEGVVRKLLDDDMVLVYLNSIQMEIPVFISDLTRADKLPNQFSGKTEETKLKEDRLEDIAARGQKEVKNNIRTPRNEGIQIAFDPILQADGIPEKYHIYFINDTANPVLFQIDFYLNERLEESWSDTVPAAAYLQLEELFYDELNDFPCFEIECWKISTAGKEKSHRKTLKLKPKIFFKNVKTVSILQKKMHCFPVFESLNEMPDKKDSSPGNLIDYTKINAGNNSKKSSNYKLYKYTSPTEYAKFDPVIDLHIENLTGNAAKMTNSEIMQLQLQKFEEFLAKAIRLGVPQLFVIHGLGKGKLRDEIAERLNNNPYVIDFKNEHHPKFGWGATEVIL